MGKCVSCKTKIGRKLKSCPNCNMWNFENKSFNKIQIPDELKTELAKSHKIISDELTRENLEKFVSSIKRKDQGMVSDIMMVRFIVTFVVFG